MSEPKFKWKSWDLVSDDRTWFWSKPTMRLITAQLSKEDGTFEYVTELFSGEGRSMDQKIELCRCYTYFDATLNHKWYTMKYDLKKR